MLPILVNERFLRGFTSFEMNFISSKSTEDDLISFFTKDEGMDLMFWGPNQSHQDRVEFTKLRKIRYGEVLLMNQISRTIRVLVNKPVCNLRAIVEAEKVLVQCMEAVKIAYYRIKNSIKPQVGIKTPTASLNINKMQILIKQEELSRCRCNAFEFVYMCLVSYGTQVEASKIVVPRYSEKSIYQVILFNDHFKFNDLDTGFEVMIKVYRMIVVPDRLRALFNKLIPDNSDKMFSVYYEGFDDSYSNKSGLASQFKKIAEFKVDISKATCNRIVGKVIRRKHVVNMLDINCFFSDFDLKGNKSGEIQFSRSYASNSFIWEKRYARLVDNELFLYRSFDDACREPPLMRFNLRLISRAMVEQQCRIEYGFRLTSVVLAPSSTHYFLKCSNSNEYIEWYNEFTTVYEHMKQWRLIPLLENAV